MGSSYKLDICCLEPFFVRLGPSVRCRLYTRLSVRYSGHEGRGAGETGPAPSKFTPRCRGKNHPRMCSHRLEVSRTHVHHQHLSKPSLHRCLKNKSSLFCLDEGGIPHIFSFSSPIVQKFQSDFLLREVGEDRPFSHGGFRSAVITLYILLAGFVQTTHTHDQSPCSFPQLTTTQSLLELDCDLNVGDSRLSYPTVSLSCVFMETQQETPSKIFLLNYATFA